MRYAFSCLFIFMAHHHDETFLPYTPEQLFTLVADVARYPQFLPWCRAARVFDVQENSFQAELLIHYKGFSESYISRVTLHPHHAIEVDMVKGPFAHLTNHWRFNAVEGGAYLIFDLDFQFRSRLLESLMGGFFSKAQAKMVEAFRARAESLYQK